jgi:hypothetical protein
MPRTCRQAEGLAATHCPAVIIRGGEDGIDVSAASGAGLRSTFTRTVRAACASVGLSRALAHPIPRRFPLFDPACLPASVLHRLAVAGYWTFPAELRQRLDRWTELDELETDAAERQLDLMGSALAR